MSSYRTGVGYDNQHNPMNYVAEYAKSFPKKSERESYGRVRGSDATDLFDRKFSMSESFGKPGKNPTNLITGVTIVIIIVLIIILVSYFIHLNLTSKSEDREYLDQFRLWGAEEPETEEDETVEVISETPAIDVLQGGNSDIASLMSENKQGAYII